jgi:thioredoxin-related protein
MKKLISMMLMLCAFITFSACSSDDDGPTNPVSNAVSDYRISGIPRFILLDPNGRIVNPDMTRPSSEDTEKILNSQPGL